MDVPQARGRNGPRIWIAIAAAGSLALALCCAGVQCGIVPVNADARAGFAETWLATTVLNATVQARAAGLSNPLPASAQTLSAGMHVYADHCMVCHGGATGQASSVARGLYQKPPQFGDGSMTDDPQNTTYWKIAHGIRFTGMPAFVTTLSPQQIWQVTAFLHRIDALPEALRVKWRSMK